MAPSCSSPALTGTSPSETRFWKSPVSSSALKSPPMTQSAEAPSSIFFLTASASIFEAILRRRLPSAIAFRWTGTM